MIPNSSHLFLISEALHIDLGVSQGEVIGGGGVVIPSVDGGPPMLFNVKVVRALTEEQTMVLFSISGDLFLLAAVNGDSNTLSLFFLDGKGSPEWDGVFSPSHGLFDVISQIKAIVVGSFFYTAGMWRVLKL